MEIYILLHDTYAPKKMPVLLYLQSRHPFFRRLFEADHFAVGHHPRGDGADGHTMDGLWGERYIKVTVVRQ